MNAILDPGRTPGGAAILAASSSASFSSSAAKMAAPPGLAPSQSLRREKSKGPK